MNGIIYLRPPAYKTAKATTSIGKKEFLIDENKLMLLTLCRIFCFKNQNNIFFFGKLFNFSVMLK